MSDLNFTLPVFTSTAGLLIRRPKPTSFAMSAIDDEAFDMADEAAKTREGTKILRCLTEKKQQDQEREDV